MTLRNYGEKRQKCTQCKHVYHIFHHAQTKFADDVHGGPIVKIQQNFDSEQRRSVRGHQSQKQKMWHSKYQGLTRLMVSKLSGVSISQIICIYASGHALFLSRKASQFTHEYFMYAKVKMLVQSSRFVCVILAVNLHENPRHSSFGSGAPLDFQFS